MALDALEQYPLEKGRDRLIHVQVANKQLIERMKSLPVILDIQPRFVVSDFPWVMERLGEERMDYSFAWNTLLDAGLICAGGSDAPIEPVDPLLGIHAAVTRRKKGEDHEDTFLMRSLHRLKQYNFLLRVVPLQSVRSKVEDLSIRDT